MEQIKPTTLEPIVHPAHQTDPNSKGKMPEEAVVKTIPADNNTKMKLFAIGAVVVLAGIGTGYALSGASAKTSGPEPTSNVAQESQAGGPAVDESGLSEPEQGVLHEGGTEAEGTHYLDRGLGPEKYIYLLSTVLSLDSYVGKKVEIQGHSLGAEKAGWLMDVVRVKVLE